MRKEKRDTLLALHGESYAKRMKETPEDSEMQVVTIELPPRLSEYTSEEDDESVSRTPDAIGQSASAIDNDDYESKLVEKTPIDHRRKVKL